MKKSIQMSLDTLNVVVDVHEGATDTEILEVAKKAVVKQLTAQFPFYKYSIVDGEVMADSDIHPGRPVKIKSSGEIGIILEIKTGNKFPIHVALSNGKTMSCTKQALEKVSKKMKIDKFIKGRQKWEMELKAWPTGTTAYFVNGKDIIPVIISQVRTKMKAYVIGHDVMGTYYTLTSTSTTRLFDSFEEAEKYVKTITA